MVADAAKDAVAPRLALADYYMATHRAAEAVKLLEAVAQMKDGRSPATIRLARYQYANGQKPAAQARLDKLIAAEPKNAEAMLAKAAFLAGDGNLDAALGQATAAENAAPRLARAHFAVANICESKGDYERAEKAYQEALRLNPRFGAASLGLARLYLATGRGDQAVQFADQAVKDLPQRADGYYVLVRALMARGDRDRTELQLKPLLARFGNLAQVQSLAGLVAASRNDKAAARKAFEAALKIDPRQQRGALGPDGRRPCRSQTGGRHRAHRGPERPRRRPTLRLLRWPGAPTRCWATGPGRKRVEEGSRARRATSPPMGRSPRSTCSRSASPRRGRSSSSLAERRRSSAAAQTMVGYLLELETASPRPQRYQKALEIDPRSAVAANNLAWLYADGCRQPGHRAAARATAKAGLPSSPEVNDTLGWIYYKKGLTTLALGPLFQAVDKGPKNAASSSTWGWRWRRTGRRTGRGRRSRRRWRPTRTSLARPRRGRRWGR